MGYVYIPTVKIHNAVPFSAAIHGTLILRDVPLDALITTSHRYDDAYLAWQTVRKTRNPFFDIGTGFEGYFFGECQSPEDALTAILDIGETMLTSVIRLHRYENRFHTRMLRTLAGECQDTDTLYEWAAQFGAVLGRLRLKVRDNPAAYHFQWETYQMVLRLPDIAYDDDGRTISQDYAVAGSSASEMFNRITLSTDMLRPDQRDAWMVAQTVGQFGHPLVREYLHYLTA